MHQSLWWELEAWKFSPAPPCVAALLGQDDPCWRPLFMVQFPCAPSLEPSQPELPIPPLPSALVVWGHGCRGEDAFGKDVVLLCLLAKFPV